MISKSATDMYNQFQVEITDLRAELAEARAENERLAKECSRLQDKINQLGAHNIERVEAFAGELAEARARLEKTAEEIKGAWIEGYTGHNMVFEDSAFYPAYLSLKGNGDDS